MRGLPDQCHRLEGASEGIIAHRSVHSLTPVWFPRERSKKTPR
jgi:hypothetical protein